MRGTVLRAGLILLAVCGLAAGAGLMIARTMPSRPQPALEQPAPREGRQQLRWANGHTRSDVTYRADAYEGEYRTWYESGAPYELRHYVNGHEDGVQQSWTESGVLYLNYEVHDGRRYGLVNATPCNVVGKRADFPQWPGTRPSERPGERPNKWPNKWPNDQLANWPTSEALPYYSSADFTPRWSPVAHRVRAFRVRTQTGAMLSSDRLRGHPYVASFIYTQCAAVCPLLVAQLTRVQAAIAESGARIVSFSVTPDTDTPQVLARFGKERRIDPRIWSLATGDKQTIYALARESYFADDNRAGASADDASAFLHTEKLVLVDGDGHLRGIYNGTQPHAVDQLIEDLSRLSARP